MTTMNPTWVKALGLTCILASAVSGASCKKTQAIATVKGVTADDSTAKQLNYALLDGDDKKSRPLIFTFFYAYQEFPEDAVPPGADDPTSDPQAQDLGYQDLNEWQHVNDRNENEATQQARKMMVYLRASFPSLAKVTLPQNTTELNLADHIAPSDTIYVESYEGSGPETNGRSIHVDVVLGRALNAQDPQISMPPAFADILAQGFANSDISVFNGHIWEFPNGNSVYDTLSPGQNTSGLVQRIKDLGGRKNSYGLVFMNVCKSEFIEKQMISALGDSNVLLLSNRYFNTYGNHARQSEYVLTDIIGRRTSQVLMTHLMIDLESKLSASQSADLIGPDPHAATAAAVLDVSGYLASITEPTGPGTKNLTPAPNSPTFAPVSADKATVVVVRVPDGQ